MSYFLPHIDRMAEQRKYQLVLSVAQVRSETDGARGGVTIGRRYAAAANVVRTARRAMGKLYPPRHKL